MAENKSETAAAATSSKTNSKELLSVTGDGSTRSVVESLLKKQSPMQKGDGPKTFKIARSPLLDELQSFLPAIQKSNQQLLDQTSEEIDALDIENIDEDDKIIEMDVVLGEMAKGGDGEASDSDSDESEEIPVMGPITEENLRIPSEAKGGKRQGTNLITDVTGATESEDDRSDGELTVASSNSAER